MVSLAIVNMMVGVDVTDLRQRAARLVSIRIVP